MILTLSEEFLTNLDKVLTRLEEKGVVVKLKKCFFGTPEVEFLGHICSSTGIRLSTKRTQAVLDIPIVVSYLVKIIFTNGTLG
jgi:hypothetical protein